MLYCRLKRVGPAQLRINDNEADGPINHNGQADQKYSASKKASVPEGVRLTNDTSTAALVSIYPI